MSKLRVVVHNEDCGDPPNFLNRTGATGKELFDEARSYIVRHSGNGAEKMAIFDDLVEHITEVTNGKWTAFGVMKDDAKVYLGGRGQSFVIDSQGRVWQGKTDDAITFDDGTGNRMSIDYTQLTHLLP